ncbi:DUF4349 domain-containing protein [Tenacibaculum jejuense]|uniref:DUF4349 domain-containing protein n=1 Tax=Tenacibaculum jejuense TaxID=584609 RepID=A0A238U6W5_9FLAO|nr:DUF4349 domain-containing protein [Tenacibaculum jejuense]SNR14214.1 conserved exported protein of unknown function [Tenacibaculum jejuense]
MKVYSIKTQLKWCCLFLMLLQVFACSKKSPSYRENISVSESYASENDLKASAASEEVKYKSTIETIEKQKLKIIKTGELKLKVKNVKRATAQIKTLLEKYNAYIANLRYENTSYQKQNNFTIKVPKAYFDMLLDSISTYAEVLDYENVSTQDVTEEFLDIETRLATKLQVKERYETILKKKAKTVEDIIYAEEKLGAIQEEIEVAQGRLKYLSNRVMLSTIHVKLYEEIPYKVSKVKTETFGSKFKRAISFGWTFLENLVLTLVHIWPVILIGVVGFLLYRKRKKTKLENIN